MINQNAHRPTSALRKSGPTPNSMMGYLRRFMAWHFSNPNYISDPALKGFIWTPDTTIDTNTGLETTKDTIDSKILIEPVWKYQPNTTQQRPAIVVKRNTINTKRISIGDQLHGIDALLGDVDPNQYGIVSDTQTMFQFEGSFSLICLGNNAATVEALGYETFGTLVTHVPIILEDLNLLDFQVQALEGVGKLEEDKEIFALPVNVTYAYIMGAILRPEAPLLKGFLIDTVTE